MQRVASLVTSYFTQFTKGCERVCCDHPLCCSSARFGLVFIDANDAALAALQHAIQHPFKPESLCPGLNPLFSHQSLLPDLYAIPALFNRIARGQGDTAEQKDFAQKVIAIFSNSSVFPFLLQGESHAARLTAEDLDLTDDTAFSLAKLIGNHMTLFRHAEPDFKAMIQDLLNAVRAFFDQHTYLKHFF
jgi:hypothetical protein